MRKSKDTLTIGAIFFHVNVPLNYPKRASNFTGGCREPN